MSFAVSRAAGLAAWIALAATISPAHAADASKTDKAAASKKESSLGKAKPGLPMLTKAQLRACLAQNDSIKKRVAEALPTQSALKKEGDELAQAGEALKNDRMTLDAADEVAVNAFNERIVARDKAIDAYQARTAEYNARVEALQADKTAYQNDCDGRRYFEDEELQIRSGK